MFTRLRLAVFSFLLLGSVSAAPMPWTQLKVGMSADEIVSLLGDPVLRSKGRGFEIWTYEHGAEVLIYGLVVGWTTPASATILVRSQDVWADHPGGEYFATLRAAVRQPARKAPAAPPVRPLQEKPAVTPGMGYEQYLKG